MSRKVPEGWRETTLGEVCQPESLAVSVEPGRTYKLMGVRWYGNGPHLHSEVSGDKLNTKTLNQVRGGQITYNKMWVSKGAFGVVPPSHDGMFATTEYPTFTGNSRVLDADFLRHYMKQESFRDMALARCRGTTSRARLNPKDFLQLEVLLPPLSEQRRIAEILSSVDEAIAATQAVIEQTRTVKQGVLKRLLTKGIGHTRFKQTEIGEIPEAWEVVCLRDVCESMKYGTSAKCEGGADAYPVLRIPNVSGERLDLSDLKFADLDSVEATKFMVREDDLLAIRTNGNPNYIGKMSLVQGVPKGSLYASYLIRIRVNNELCLPEYVHLSSQGDVMRKSLFESARTSAGNYNINTKGLGDAILTLPPLNEQRKIIDEVASLERAIAENLGKLRHLEQIKSALVSDLLTGRKRVPMDELTAAE
jgi:type I restriction enzyme S subunit